MATSAEIEGKGEEKKIVDLKEDCPHAECIEKISIDLSLPCKACGKEEKVKEEHWLGLKCSYVYCNSHVREHIADQNTQNPSHEIVCGLSDFRFWCYTCNSYIDSPHLKSILRASHHLESSLEKEVLLSRIRATIYGNCIGDAIGLLTEFMTKKEAYKIYGCKEQTKKKIPIEKLGLEYNKKHDDFHRSRWEVGDWTDDSDQMILILRTLLEHNGKVDILDFAKKFKVWTRTGYRELGDFGGMGIGTLTSKIVRSETFSQHPHECAEQVWVDGGRWAAPNGGVMRTSILGIQDFSHIPTVIKNTQDICKVTHADPRCIASCVAVTTAIALMLQGKHRKGDGYDEKAICKEAYKYACNELSTDKEKKELRKHMFAKKLSKLELSVDDKIGYTYKCLGSGFWAFRQKDFRLALTELVMEAGDADTNGAVAGALLGCKLGEENLPKSWLNGLCHKDWLDPQIDRYLRMLGLEYKSREESTSEVHN